MVFTPQATQAFTGVETNDWSNDSGDSDISVDDVFNFENASAADISDRMQKDPEWAKNNGSLIDYWLNEKSYYGREDTKIARYMEQLKQAGINPILAYQYAGNASASGGAQAGVADYNASMENVNASKQNAQVSAGASLARGLMVLLGVGLSLLLKNPAPLLLGTTTLFGDGYSQTTRHYG